MSTINTNPINVNYPVPGVNNNSQGFRDNFASIVTNLNTAGAELTDLQNKVVVKQALIGTTVNNDMANTLISNASTRSFRATTYNLGGALSGTVLVNTSLADVHYGTVAENTQFNFGSWAPAGTQANVQLNLTVSNSLATIAFSGNVVVDNANNNGTSTLENFVNIDGLVTVTVPYGVTQLNYLITTTDCGSTLYVSPINRPRVATAVQQRTPTPTGMQGDVAGDVAVDNTYLYICSDSFNSGGGNTVVKTATATVSSGNLINVGSTTNLVVSSPIVFTGTTFGGIVANTTYYIKSLDGGGTSITVSEIGYEGVPGSAFAVSTASGTMTATSYNGDIIWRRMGVDSPAGNITIDGNLTVTYAANIGTTLNVVGNSNVGNLGTGGLIVATGNVTGGNLVTGGRLTVTGNANTGNLGTTRILASGNITATQLISNVATGTAPLVVTSTTLVPNLYVARANVASYANITALSSSGTYYPVFVNSSGASGNYALGTDNGLVFNATTNTVTTSFYTGTLTTAAQPNITSVGTLTSLGVNGTVTAVAFTANTGVFTGNGNGLRSIVGANVTGNVGNALYAYSVAVANVVGIGNIATVNLTGSTSTVLYGNGVFATPTTTTSISNGNSNVSIPAANGNVNISAVGNANILVVTGTGVNVAGTLNTGSGNITGGNLIGPLANGNSNVNIPAANGNVNISAVGNANILVVTGTGANITGTANISGNANVGNLGTAQVLATANITAPQLISNVAIGTAPLVVTSTTQVANLAVATAGNVAATLTSTGTAYLPFISATTTGNYPLQSNANFSANLANGYITATGFVGNGAALTDVSATVSNGTSNVSIPSINGNVNIVSAGNTTLAVTGTGANITGTGNFSGNVNAANLIGTGLYTNGTTGNAQIFYDSSNNSVGAFQGNIANYIQTYLWNSNVNANASASFAVYDTVGPTGSNFVDIGILSNTWSNASWTISGASDAYMYSGNSNLAIGTASSSNIIFFTGGTLAANERMRITTTGANITGTGNFSGNLSAANLIGPHANGNSNVNIPAANGNVNISAVGNANILVITGTGVNVAGTGNFTGNLSAAAHYGPLANGNSNVNIPAANGNVNISAVGNANILVVTGTGVNVAGTLNTGSGNINTTGNVSGAFFIGNGSQLTGLTISAGTAITNGNSNVSVVANANVNFSITGTPNVVSVTSGGIITSATNATITANNHTASGAASGNANVSTVTGNLGIRALAATYTDSVVAASTTVANAAIHAIDRPTLTATNASVTFTNAATFYIANSPANSGTTLITNPYSLFVAGGNSFFGGNIIGVLANGNSNVNIPAANGNVNISSAGNANVLTVTGTGANITGTANVSGLITGGNISTTSTDGTVTANNHTITGAANGNSNVSTITGNLGLRSLVTTYNEGNATASEVIANAAIHAIATPTVTATNTNVTATNMATFYIQSAPVQSTNMIITNPYALYVAAGNSFFGGNIIGVVANGTSNITMATSGNVSTFVGGNTTAQLVITSIGANIPGTATIGTANITTVNSSVIQNGNSNVSIVANANVNFGVTGTANVASITAAGIITTAANAAVTSNGFTASGVATGNSNVSTITGNLGIRALFSTYTDNSAISGATIANAAIHAFAAPNLAAANTLVTFTNAATMYIGGAPVANTNATITNPYALFVAGGNSFFGGSVIGTIANGTSNLRMTLNGNVTISAAGASNVFTVTGTGANVTGTANISGNANVGNIGAVNAIITTAANIPLIRSGTSNITLASGGNVSTFIGGNATAQLVVTSIGANIPGTATIGTANITTVNSSVIQNGNSNVSITANANINFNVTSTNIASITTAGILTNSANAAISANNFTATGAATGNLNVGTVTGNLGIRSISAVYSDPTATGAVAYIAAHAIATPTYSTTSSVTAGNAASFYIQAAPANAGALQLSTANSYALFVAAGNSFFGGNIIGGPYANGNSNVNIPAANGNVNISAVGIANVLVVTGTGANITGTANITGNANVGNIGATQGIFSTSANIPLIISGTSNITLTSGANVSTFIGGNATAQFVVTATGANIPGTANITGLITGGNISTTGANGTVTANNHTVTGAATGNMNVTTVTGNLGLRSISTTYTDNVVAALGTLPIAAAHAIATPTYSTTAAGIVTANNAATFYIQAAPIPTANFVFGSSNANAWSLYVGGGNSFFGGNIVGTLANGNSNISIAAANANVNISAVGVANVLVVTGTGANIAGTGNFTGNLTAAAHYGPLANTTSNVSIPAAAGNVNISVGGTANVLVLTATGANIPGTANVVGLITGGNISTTGANGTVTANNHTITGAATGNVNVGTIAGNVGLRAVSATYTDNQAAATVANAAIHAIATPTIVGSNAMIYTNMATFYIQSDVTASGANATITNNYALFVAQGNSFFGGNIIGTLANGNSNVRIATPNANVVISAVGVANVLVVTGTGANIAGTGNFTGNLTAAAYYGPLANTTSNVNIPAAAGNVNISVGGTANVLVVTGTGANITGTANITGNANAANFGTGTAVITTGNITTINSGLMQNGTANITITSNGNISIFANANATAALVIANSGINVPGYSNVVGSITGGNISTTGANGTVQANNFTVTGAATGNMNVGTVTGNLGFRSISTTYTDNIAISSGTIPVAAAHAIATPTYAATNSVVTATNAATFYIQAAPIPTASMVFGSANANAWAMYVGGGNSYFGGNVRVTAGGITSNNSTAGVGYAAGAGSTGTQGTNRNTAVAMTAPCVSGSITLFSTTTLANTWNNFAVSNVVCTTSDIVILNMRSGGSLNSYTFDIVSVGANTFTIQVYNAVAVVSGEAPVLGFAIIKGAVS
jgi:hypothetical protein